MKNLILKVICALGFIFMLVRPVSAGVFEFNPTPSDLDDLYHLSYYEWGINWEVPSGDYIEEAVLLFDNIDNWEDEDNYFYIHLLDSALEGTHEYTDNQGGGDNFDGQGILIDIYTDDSTGSPIDLSYTFSDLDLLDDLTSYASNGNFGFGLDPDCHYENDGISFTITTRPIPEPSSIILLGMGLSGMLTALKRKKH